MDIGTGLAVSLGGSPLGEIVDVALPEGEIAMIDTSHYGTSGGKTYSPADLIDNGELKVDMALVPGSISIAGTTGEVIITFPDATTWTFAGIISKNTPTAPLEDRMINSVVIKVSGAITVA